MVADTCTAFLCPNKCISEIVPIRTFRAALSFSLAASYSDVWVYTMTYLNKSPIHRHLRWFQSPKAL